MIYVVGKLYDAIENGRVEFTIKHKGKKYDCTLTVKEHDKPTA